jgi:hypothetical protein
MTDCLQYKAVKTFKSTRWSRCFSCNKDFEINQRRNEWRLLLPRCNRYLQGMFWTIQCDECWSLKMYCPDCAKVNAENNEELT